jgi:hypothetical protein
VPILYIFFCLLFSTSFIFGSSDDSKIEQYYKRAQALAENGEYTDSLKYFNQALGYLRQSPSSHPMRIAIEREVRIVKGKSLVARYQERMKLKNPNYQAQPLPLNQEPSDLLIEQFFGKILAREIWQPVQVDILRKYLGFGRRVTVLPKSGIELLIQNNSSKLRAVDAASFIINKNGNVDLHTGSYCIYFESKNSSLRINSPLSTVKLSSESPFACMVGVTTNGGLKIINLLGAIILKKEESSEEIRPGQLIFSLPQGFSRKMDVELSTLMVTSKLLTSFDTPPVFYKKLRQQAMLQALRTRKRFKTIIGDVKDRENFQIKVLQKENN